MRDAFLMNCCLMAMGGGECSGEWWIPRSLEYSALKEQSERDPLLEPDRACKAGEFVV